MTTTYGKRGGEGPTRGKRATTYEATAPDGSRLVKRVFYQVAGDSFGMLAYLHEGRWRPNAVHPAGQPPAWHRPSDTCVSLPARRVDR